MRPIPISLFFRFPALLVAIATATLAADFPAGSLPASLPARLPATSAWKITFAYTDDAAGPASRFAIYLPKTITVEKSGKTIHETTLYHSGKSQERWLKDTREAVRTVDSETAVTADYGGDPPPEHFAYRLTDFQDLGWLGPQTLRGTGTYKGRSVLVFVAPSTEDKTSVAPGLKTVPTLPVPFGKTRERIAALDAETFLPLYYFDGGCARTYDYLAPPAAPLTPPPDFARALAPPGN